MRFTPLIVPFFSPDEAYVEGEGWLIEWPQTLNQLPHRRIPQGQAATEGASAAAAAAAATTPTVGKAGPAVATAVGVEPVGLAGKCCEVGGEIATVINHHQPAQHI